MLHVSLHEFDDVWGSVVSDDSEYSLQRPSFDHHRTEQAQTQLACPVSSAATISLSRMTAKRPVLGRFAGETCPLTKLIAPAPP